MQPQMQPPTPQNPRAIGETEGGQLASSPAPAFSHPIGRLPSGGALDSAAAGVGITMALPGQVMGSITLPIVNMAPYAVPMAGNTAGSPVAAASPMAVSAGYAPSTLIGRLPEQPSPAASRLSSSSAAGALSSGAPVGSLTFLDPGMTQAVLCSAQQSAQAVALRQRGALEQPQPQQPDQAQPSSSHIGTTTHAGGGSGLQRMEAAAEGFWPPGALPSSGHCAAVHAPTCCCSGGGTCHDATTPAPAALPCGSASAPMRVPEVGPALQGRAGRRA